MQTGNEEDLALCARAARGDQPAFAILVARHEQALRSFLSRMISPDRADDVAQEAFLKAWRFASSYDGRARFSTWLTRIAWRCLIDETRKSKPSEPVERPAHAADSEQASQIADMLARLTGTRAGGPDPVRRARLVAFGGRRTAQHAARQPQDGRRPRQVQMP